MQPAALVFEMLTPALALRAQDLSDADAASLDSALEWTARGWPEFGMYHPIFLAAPGAAIFGGDLPGAKVRQALAEGAMAAMGPGGALFGLDEPLPPGEQAAREADQQDAHCGAMPADMLPGMVEAQRLRDAALARAVLAALAETGGPVAVITGNGHARRDRGVPVALLAAAPDLDVVSVGQFESAPAPDAPFDHLALAPAPADRGDPCDAFR